MPERPNIILIITDQQRFDTIAALGYAHMRTPNLDRLVREGTALERCYVTAPSCVSSRASFFTGCYPHTTGVLTNYDMWQHSWIEDLARGGYHCVNIGKMHTLPLGASCGFAERYVVENKDRYVQERYYWDEWDKFLGARGIAKPGRELYRQDAAYESRLGVFPWSLDESCHPDCFTGDLAIRWLRSRPRIEPLFLQIGFPGPHPPYDAPKTYAESYLQNKDLPIREVRAGDIDGQPEVFRNLIRHCEQSDSDSVVHRSDASREDRLLQRSFYLGNVTLIDRKVGEIVMTLEELGYLNDAVIVFTSDHGDCLGDHGHIQKWTMYEEVLRVPMILFSPGRIAGGVVDPRLWQQFDIVPSLFELSGIEQPPVWEAAEGAVLDRDALGRRFVFAEQGGGGGILEGMDLCTMVRSAEWKAVHFLGQPFGQLFDLLADPHEETNLWDRSEHRPTRQFLLDEMREWALRSNYSTRALRRTVS